jgi:uncharacterized phage infection (PIP) family protein YhgE
MRIGLLPLVAATGVLMAAGAIVVFVVGADTGGGGGLQGYFTALQAAQTQIDGQFSTIAEQYPESFSDKQETIDYLDEGSKVLSDGAGKLGDIDPPEEARADHQALVQATGDISETFASLRDDAGDVEDTVEAITELVNTADTAAFDAYGTACANLQTIADSNSIEVFITCIFGG